jgi:hypothetical protein
LLLQVQAQQPTQTQNPEVRKTIIINTFLLVRQRFASTIFATGMTSFYQPVPYEAQLKVFSYIVND